MATVDEDMNEQSMHLLLSSLSCNLDVETLSPEDVAWADSCLNKEVDAADADWTSIKDALLEIISSHEESLVNFSGGSSSMPLGADDSFHFGEELKSVDSSLGSAKGEDLIDGGLGDAETIDIADDDNNDDDMNDLLLRNKRGPGRDNLLVDNVFRPNYSEDLNFENHDYNLSSSLPTNDLSLSLEDIFKVWDLGITDEQDELTEQLNKALADVPSQIESYSNDSATLKDHMHVSIDDIISGIDDLSLKQDA